LGCASTHHTSGCYPSAATAAKTPLHLLSQAGRRWQGDGQMAVAQTKPRASGDLGREAPHQPCFSQLSAVERTASGSPLCNCS